MTKSIIVRTSCWQEIFDMKKLHMTRSKIEKTNMQQKLKDDINRIRILFDFMRSSSF
jgi:hypothetical protein